VKDLTEELFELRAGVDEIDAQILVLLARRFANVRRMGEIKTSLGRPLRDPAREKQVLSRLSAMNEKLQQDIPQDFLEEMFGCIIQWSLKIQQRKGF
jgi:chorismate mutase